MELLETILPAISTVGFPIVMCLVMLFYLQKNNERHSEEVKSLKDAIENNTIAIVKICEKLEAG